MLLDHAGQRAELLLGRLRGLVQHPVEPRADDDEHRIGRHRPQGQPRVDGEHRGERADEREQRAGDAHGAEADQLLDGGDVAGGAGHEVARRMRREERRRERREGAVEIVTDVVLDPLRPADDGEPRPESGQPVADGEQQNHQRIGADRGGGRVGLQGLDGALHHPRDAEALQRRGEQTDGPERVTGAVTGEIPPDRARCRRQRLPSPKGVRAA